MVAVCISQTSDFNEMTRCYIPENCHPHTLRRENLKSHTVISFKNCYIFVVCILFYDAFSMIQTTERRMQAWEITDELQGIWKEAVMA
jgi:hypothetical protein